jgi:hypothetical protein
VNHSADGHSVESRQHVAGVSLHMSASQPVDASKQFRPDEIGLHVIEIEVNWIVGFDLKDFKASQ